MNNDIQIIRADKYTSDLITKFRAAFPEMNWDDSHLSLFLDSTANILLYAEKQGTVCGLIRAHILPRYDDKNPEILLHGIDVLSTYRRQGIATMLIDELKNIASQFNGSEIWVLTNASNQAAMGLYQKSGLKRQHPDDVMLQIDL